MHKGYRENSGKTHQQKAKKKKNSFLDTKKILADMEEIKNYKNYKNKWYLVTFR